jgi:hypothetical protein
VRREARAILAALLIIGTFVPPALALERGPNTPSPLLSTSVQIMMGGGLAPPSPQLSLPPQASQPPPQQAAPQSGFGRNIRVSTDEPGPVPFENEPTIAVNPNNEQNIVVTSHDFNTPYVTGKFVPATYYSLDGGETWQGPILQNLTYGDFTSDPGLAVDSKGNFYLSYLSINSTLLDDDVTVAVSRDGGVHWSIRVAAPHDGRHLHDKPYIAVGPSALNPGQEAIYVTYTDFNLTNFATALKVVRSDDGGRTWTAPMLIKSTAYPGLQGTAPAVAPDGTLYVAYFGFLPLGGEPEPGIFLSVSHDGGNTFSAPRLVSRINFWTPGFCQSGPYGFRTAPLPSIAVGSRGEVYIAYNSASGTLTRGPVDPSDIYFVYSTDGGITWSQPVKVNDDNTTAGQFMPWISYRKSDGSLHLAWVDQRLSKDGFGYDIFYSYSTDGGRTWASNQRVTDYTSSLLAQPLFVSSACGLIFFIGDYINMAVSPTQVYVVWTDSRRGFRTGISYFGTNEDIYFAKLGPRGVNVTLRGAPMAGFGTQLSINASGLSGSAFYDVWLNGTLLSSGLIADREGRLGVRLPLPSLGQGSYEVQLVEHYSNLIVASKSFAVAQSDVQSGIRQLEALSSGLLSQVNRTSSQLRELSDSVQALKGQLALAVGTAQTAAALALVELVVLALLLFRLRKLK